MSTEITHSAPSSPKEYKGDITTISNEVELSLLDADAREVLATTTDLELDPEVNKVDVIELLVSMATNVGELNGRLFEYLASLVSQVEQQGGKVYSGSSLLRDVSHREPSWYRTTSLSRTLATGLLDITSQQVVIGISNEAGGEKFGIDLYNLLKDITPVMLAFSASSPFKAHNGLLKDTGAKSRRIHQYENATKHLPREMLLVPQLESLDHYFDVLQTISDAVNAKLSNGELDQNDEELYRTRENGKAHAPFTTLDPHQIYWMVRPRPDHANADSLMSLEVRVPDVPISVERMQLLNSFVLGIAYYAADYGFDDLHKITSHLKNGGQDILNNLKKAAINGITARIGTHHQEARWFIKSLASLAKQGLENRGLLSTDFSEGVNTILSYGSDADGIRHSVQEQGMQQARDLELFLSRVLLQSINTIKK